MNMFMYDRNQPYNSLPEFPRADIHLDMQIMTQWGYASRALAELNKNVLRMPNPSMLINTISLQEAQTSTAIENIFTTEDELYKAVSDSIKEEDANPATKEVLRYREALWKGFSEINSGQMFGEKVAISVYQQVKNTTQGIRPPQSLTVIRRVDSQFRSGEIVYTPPRGEGIIEQKLRNLFDFLNTPNEFDPLLKMVIGHYQFEAIHPFSDGNGRTGRILNQLYLINQQLLYHPVLYLSKYIIQNKDDYYHLLSGVTQRNAWKPWIIYMLEAVDKTAQATNRKIDDIILQMEATLQYAQKKLKWYTIELNQALFSQPYIKQKRVGEVTGVNSRTTLTKYMKSLVDLGILSAKIDGREVYYVNNDLIRILEG